MAVLSDGTIREEVEAGRLLIEPFREERLQPASFDVTLDGAFELFWKGSETLDVRRPNHDASNPVEVEDGEAFVLAPGEFALGQTRERIGLPDDLVAGLHGKSSLGRLGLQVHATAGWGDPGFNGTVTLELANLAPRPIALYPGMPIGQLCFLRLDRAAERPYGSPELGSKYQGQVMPTTSRFHLNFEDRR